MRLPKATLRNTGYRMMTASIKVNIGLDEIVNGLAQCSDEYGFETGDPSKLESVTRTQAYKYAVETIHRKGYEWYPETGTNANIDLDEDDLNTVINSRRRCSLNWRKTSLTR